MSDHAQEDRALPVGLPRDLTAEEFERAPVLTSVDDLLIEDLTDEEADASYAAIET